MFYKIIGEGEPIIWVHGLTLNHESWYAQVQHFSPNYKNICCDLRGYGKSQPLPKGEISVTDLYAQDIVNLIKSLGLVKPTLVGFASAGHVSLKVAAEHPDLLGKLAIINASPRFSQCDNWPYGFTKSSLEKFKKALQQANTVSQRADILLTPALSEVGLIGDNSLYNWFESMMNSAKSETILAFFSDIANQDIRGILSNITVPTLIISSLLGKEVPIEVGRYLVNVIKNAHLVEINDMGHFVFATQSSIVNQIIDQFLKPHCSLSLPTNF